MLQRFSEATQRFPALHQSLSFLLTTVAADDQDAPDVFGRNSSSSALEEEAAIFQSRFLSDMSLETPGGGCWSGCDESGGPGPAGAGSRFPTAEGTTELW